MRMRRCKQVTLALAAAISIAPAALAACPVERAIYASGASEDRVIVYGLRRAANIEEVRFEGWRDKTLLWRATAEFTCSNGASTCYILVEGEEDGPGDPTAAVFETIADHGEDPYWVIFAGLGQKLYYSRGPKVEWFIPEEKQFDLLALPNIYRFDACRETDALPD